MLRSSFGNSVSRKLVRTSSLRKWEYFRGLWDLAQVLAAMHSSTHWADRNLGHPYPVSWGCRLLSRRCVPATSIILTKTFVADGMILINTTIICWGTTQCRWNAIRVLCLCGRSQFFFGSAEDHSGVVFSSSLLERSPSNVSLRYASDHSLLFSS